MTARRSLPICCRNHCKVEKLCLDQLGCEDFYVVYYSVRNAHRRILKHFDEAEIKYFDYSDLFNPDDAEFNHVGDGQLPPTRINFRRSDWPRAFRYLTESGRNDVHVFEANERSRH